MLIGSLVLGPRHLPWFIVFMLVLVVIAIARQDDDHASAPSAPS